MSTLLFSLRLTSDATICVKVKQGRRWLREDIALEGKTRATLIEAVWWAFYTKGVTRDKDKLATDLDAIVWDRVPKEVL